MSRLRAIPENARNRGRTAGNLVRSKLDIGDYWFWFDDKKIETEYAIWPIIFPLRYDVLIRKSFFELYGANRELYINDFKRFMLLAGQHPYYEWFSKVLVVRYFPQIIGSEKSLAAEYENRVVTSAKLYESIMAQGFDEHFPIILYTGKTILPADTGRKMDATYYMGDGCHRLACLMSMGYEALPKKYVRVKCFKRLVPLDNTRMLASSVSVDKKWV